MDYYRVRTLLRVSTIKQLKNGEDIPVQREACMRFISNYPDWVFDKEYIERGISGYKLRAIEREALVAIREAAIKHEFDILVVFLSDRIGRREDDTPAYIADLASYGVRVFSVKEGELKTMDMVDKFIMYMRSWSSHSESLKTSIRVIEAQQSMVRNGRFVGGSVPYGYTLVLSDRVGLHNRLLSDIVIDKEKAEVVKEVYRLAAELQYGAYKIASILNKRGLVNARGNEWRTSTINDMLKNSLYKGIITYRRHGKLIEETEEEVIQSPHIPEYQIVDTKVWDKVQRIREIRHKGESAEDVGEVVVNQRGGLLLLGLIYCGHCGAKLTNGSKYNHWVTAGAQKVRKKAGYYRCINRLEGSGKCDGASSYSQARVEDTVLHMVYKYLKKLDITELKERLKIKRKNELGELQERLEELGQQEKQVAGDIRTLEDSLPEAIRGGCIIDLTTLSHALNNKRDELSEIKREMTDLNTRYASRVDSINEYEEYVRMAQGWEGIFTDSSVEKKRILLAKMISRIDIFKDRMVIEFRFEEKKLELVDELVKIK